jgi:hypothetical protein
MTVEAANAKAMELAKRMKQDFFLLSIRRQAERIGCAFETWKKTPFYKQAQQKRAQAAQRAGGTKRPSSPATISLTPQLESVVGDTDAELSRLMEEQRADSEPSPLDNDPSGRRPRKVHARKRL